MSIGIPEPAVVPMENLSCHQVSAIKRVRVRVRAKSNVVVPPLSLFLGILNPPLPLPQANGPPSRPWNQPKEVQSSLAGEGAGGGGQFGRLERKPGTLYSLWFKLTARKNVISGGGVKMSECCRVVAMAPTLVIAWFTDMEVNPYSSQHSRYQLHMFILHLSPNL
jgi:hypothetical protein